MVIVITDLSPDAQAAQHSSSVSVLGFPGQNLIKLWLALRLKTSNLGFVKGFLFFLLFSLDFLDMREVFL